ncbi:aldo/keto reductase [Streptosporangium soli]|nr:hypothetical protein [Streptosporangium sp. KLBMP 9127]
MKMRELGRTGSQVSPNRRGTMMVGRVANAPAPEIVEARWAADRRGPQRFRTEQPPHSIVNRGIEREVLPTCERYGVGRLVWSPPATGLPTGRYRKGRPEERMSR